MTSPDYTITEETRGIAVTFHDKDKANFARIALLLSGTGADKMGLYDKDSVKRANSDAGDLRLAIEGMKVGRFEEVYARASRVIPALLQFVNSEKFAAPTDLPFSLKLRYSRSEENVKVTVFMGKDKDRAQRLADVLNKYRIDAKAGKTPELTADGKETGDVMRLVDIKPMLAVDRFYAIEEMLAKEHKGPSASGSLGGHTPGARLTLDTAVPPARIIIANMDAGSTTLGGMKHDRGSSSGRSRE